jgi:acyl-CoA thioester hydrolase
MHRSVATELEVRWGECDPAGIVYHPAYIDWFSVARMHFLSENGIQYMSTFNQAGIHLVVTDVACQYKKALRAQDKIKVIAHLVACTRTRLHFQYEVFDDEGAVCAVGRTVHAFVANDNAKAVNLDKFAPELWAKIRVLPVDRDR